MVPPLSLTAAAALLVALSGLAWSPSWAAAASNASTTPAVGSLPGSQLPPQPPSHPPRLRFRPDGTFLIAQFTDLHYSNDPDKDRLSDQVQQSILAAERPDLVAFSGDQVSGFAWDDQGSTPGWYASAWRQLIAPVQAAGVPYASILGNHDGEADLSRREVVALDIATGANLSLTQQGPAYLAGTWNPGASNYWLDVHSTDGSRVEARIWMLDSGNRGCDDTPDGWGCVPAAVAAWVEERAAALPRVPSLAFIHIPLPQFLELWNEHPTTGRKGKRVACPLKDTGAFDAFRRAGIQAVYSGHDHPSDFMGELRGVRLAYGRKTGWGSHGPRASKGARVIRLRLGQSGAESDTWVRSGAGEREEQGGPPTLPGDKARQERCSADNWILQRLRHRTYVVFLLSQAAAAVALVAASVAATLAVMSWRQRRQGPRSSSSGRQRPGYRDAEKGKEAHELMWLRPTAVP